MTETFTIGPASSADARAVAAIYGHHVENGTATFEFDPPGEEEMASRIDKVLAEGFPWLAARDARGRVLGYAYASRFGVRKGYRYACETTIYVREDALGRGIGTALMTELLVQCEAIGQRQALAVIAGTQEASVVLHARLGYRPVGTLEKIGRKHGQWIDVFYMQRALGDGGGTPPPGEDLSRRPGTSHP